MTKQQQHSLNEDTTRAIIDPAQSLLKDIDRATGSTDPSIRQHGYILRECTEAYQEWFYEDNRDLMYNGSQLDEDFHLDITESEIRPAFLGLKLRNEKRIDKDGYLLYTGNQHSVLSAVEQLSSFGIDSNPMRNGKNGRWRLICPGWLTIEFLDSSELGQHSIAYKFGLTLINADTIELSSFWLYEGSYDRCVKVAAILERKGISTSIITSNDVSTQLMVHSHSSKKYRNNQRQVA